MPPKADEKKQTEERKLPPPKPKIYEDEKAFKKAAKEHLKTVEIKADDSVRIDRDDKISINLPNITQIKLNFS